ncbi:MAG: sialate O-acetylesterase [Chthoniobacteraceae bacterium]
MKAPKRFSHPVHCALAVLFLTPVFHGRAEIKPASPFTDHAVLQQQMKVPVWGTATAGEKVTVDFAGQQQTAIAAKDGTWKVELDPLQVSMDPQLLKISGDSGDAPVVLQDVLVGEVWVCSGQSNMDFTVAKTKKYAFAGANNEAQEIAAANYPKLRMFSAQWTKAYTPQTTVPGVWKVCTPENVPEFSAIGYFFARDLQQELKVPVGIVTCTFGASTAQAWIRREAIAVNPQLKPELDAFDAKVKAFVPRRPSRPPNGRLRWRRPGPPGNARRAIHIPTRCRTSTTRP